MVNHRSLRDFEDVQDQGRATARRRIELAEEYIASYRSGMHRMQEDFSSVGARGGIAGDPGFDAGLRRISDTAGENAHQMGRRITELEEDYHALTLRQSHDRDRFIEEQSRDA